MIPKTIHYCWFGRNPKPELAEKCIESWKKFCPDYEIIEWNEDNFDIAAAPLYVRQAYEAKKWAFVTDYVRLKVIYENGGIYMDTDVELVKPLDNLLQHQAYFGFETVEYANTGLGFGAEKGLPLLAEMMEDYMQRPFILANGTYDETTCLIRNSAVLKKNGFLLNGRYQEVDGVSLYPSEYFCPFSYYTKKLHKTEKAYSIHWYSASWWGKEEKRQHKKQKIADKIIWAIGNENFQKLLPIWKAIKRK